MSTDSASMEMVGPDAVPTAHSGATATGHAPAGPRQASALLDIGGMTCGACAARIERRLNKIDGVEAVVNYATERASVTLGPSVSLDDVLASVSAAGYIANPTDAGDSRLDAGPDVDAVANLRSLKRRLFVAVALFMPLCDGSLYFSLFPTVRFAGWELVMLVLALPVVTWAAWPFYRAALNAARHRTTTMDTLVSIGILSATAWSVYSMISATGTYGQVALYFDVAVGVTTFLLAGRYFEARAKQRASDALRDIAAVAAKDACLVDPRGNEHRVPVSVLRVNDRFVVRSGETIPTDGVIVKGSAEVDLSAMTGESVPVHLENGAAVVGGTRVVSGYFTGEASRVGGETQLAQMLRLVEDAQNQKASVQRLADRISTVFVPFVLLASAVTLAAWLLSGATFVVGLNAAMSVLLIACPCALGLATPTAMMVASGRAASMGIFFKDYEALEASKRIDTIVLDKTGTVTSGRMRLVACEAVGTGSRASVLRLGGALEKGSEHSVGAAFADHAEHELGPLPGCDHFQAVPGLGVTGVVEGHRVLVGRERLLIDSDVALGADARMVAARWEEGGRTVVFVAVDGEAAGVVAFGDRVRPEAAQAVADFKILGLRCVLLTGDNQATAQTVANEVGIDEVIADALPSDKADRIVSLQREGQVVAMVGDGINDAPALATADLGLAIGSGTDAAISASAVVIMRDNLRVAGAAVALSRKTLRTIHQNLWWAFGYNIAAIPIAALGFLNPLVSGAAMAMSSAFVVWNSLRLRNFPRGRRLTRVRAIPRGEAVSDRKLTA